MYDVFSPVVNLNGTGKQSLLDETREAYEACRAAQDALIKMTVHGRDYQTVADGQDRLQKAQAQHRARITMLTVIMDELEARYHDIAEQGR